MLFIKQCFSYIFFSIINFPQYFVLLDKTWMSQLQNVSRVVWRCFKHDEENVMNCFGAILRQLKDIDLFLKSQKMTFEIKRDS